MKILHQFCSQLTQYNCDDGLIPYYGLVRGNGGDLYGTTNFGGTGGGVAFRIARNGTFTVLYAFSGKHSEGADAPLIVDSQGNLYGLSCCGGEHKKGSVFELAFDGSAYNYNVLYSFCSQKHCADGAFPSVSGDDGLIFDSAGNLYGTTDEGGKKACTSGGCGTVFKLSPDGTETVLYAFGTADIYGEQPGPRGPLTFDSQGNLYGTTMIAGDDNAGTVFRLAPDGTQAVLHSFDVYDGDEPYGGLVLKKGYLYGSTFAGGNSYGVIFKLKK